METKKRLTVTATLTDGEVQVEGKVTSGTSEKELAVMLAAFLVATKEEGDYNPVSFSNLLTRMEEAFSVYYKEKHLKGCEELGDYL
jgi:hypothetical protein